MKLLAFVITTVLVPVAANAHFECKREKPKKSEVVCVTYHNNTRGDLQRYRDPNPVVTNLDCKGMAPMPYRGPVEEGERRELFRCGDTKRDQASFSIVAYGDEVVCELIHPLSLARADRNKKLPCESRGSFNSPGNSEIFE